MKLFKKIYGFSYSDKLSFGKYGSIPITCFFKGTIFKFIKKYGILKFIRKFKFTEYKPRIFKMKWSKDALNDMKTLKSINIDDIEVYADKYRECERLLVEAPGVEWNKFKELKMLKAGNQIIVDNINNDFTEEQIKIAKERIKEVEKKIKELL